MEVGLSKANLAKGWFFFSLQSRMQPYQHDSALLIRVCANCEGKHYDGALPLFFGPCDLNSLEVLRFKIWWLGRKRKISLFKGMERNAVLLGEPEIGKLESHFKSLDCGRLLNIYILFELKVSWEMRIISPLCGRALKWRNRELKANSITCFNQKESSKKQSIKEQSDSPWHQCMKIC